MELAEVLNWIAPVASGAITWFLGRHLQRLEYVDKQSDIINKLQAQNGELLTEIERLQDKIVELSSKVSEYRTQLAQLQESFDIYIIESNKRLAQAENNGATGQEDI